MKTGEKKEAETPVMVSAGEVMGSFDPDRLTQLGRQVTDENFGEAMTRAAKRGSAAYPGNREAALAFARNRALQLCGSVPGPDDLAALEAATAES